VEPPPPRSWKRTGIFALGSAGVLAAGAILVVFFYLEARAADVSMVTLPSAPTRPVAPALSAAGVPAGWIPTFRNARSAANGSTTIERFAIQVASFNTQARADVMIEELARAGFKARTVTLDFGPPRGQLVVVLVGEYQSADAAQADLTRLREQFEDARLERVRGR
jgi:cell division septation protein DedD